MKELISNTVGSIGAVFFGLWLIGNLIWMAIAHTLGNMFGVSWLEVDHTLRIFSWSPTIKEVHESNMRKGKGNPEFSKNIQW